MNNAIRELSAKELVDMYSGMIYRLAYSRLCSIHDAEDVTQDVLLKYIRSQKSFRDEEHRKAWLLRVTINTIKSFVSSAYNRKRAQFNEASELTYETEESVGIADAVE